MIWDTVFVYKTSSSSDKIVLKVLLSGVSRSLEHQLLITVLQSAFGKYVNILVKYGENCIRAFYYGFNNWETQVIL